MVLESRSLQGPASITPRQRTPSSPLPLGAKPAPGSPHHAQPRARTNLQLPPWQFSPGVPKLPGLPGEPPSMLFSAPFQGECGQLLCPLSLTAPALPHPHPTTPATLPQEQEKTAGQSRLRPCTNPSIHPQPTWDWGNIKTSPKGNSSLLLQGGRAASWALFSELQKCMHAALGTWWVRSLPQYRGKGREGGREPWAGSEAQAGPELSGKVNYWSAGGGRLIYCMRPQPSSR